MTPQQPSQKNSPLEVTIPARTANLGAFVLFLILAICGGNLFSYFWTAEEVITSFRSFLTDYLVLALAILSGIVVHEALHIVVWSAFCKRHFRSIQVGFDAKNLSPYVTCLEYLRKDHFIAGVIAPFIFTGIAPMLYGIFTGSGWWFWLGAFLGAGAAGDITTIIRLRNFSSASEILDHPDHLGFLVRDPESKS